MPGICYRQDAQAGFNSKKTQSGCRRRMRAREEENEKALAFSRTCSIWSCTPYLALRTEYSVITPHSVLCICTHLSTPSSPSAPPEACPAPPRRVCLGLPITISSLVLFRPATSRPTPRLELSSGSLPFDPPLPPPPLHLLASRSRILGSSRRRRLHLCAREWEVACGLCDSALPESALRSVP